VNLVQFDKGFIIYDRKIVLPEMTQVLVETFAAFVMQFSHNCFNVFDSCRLR